MRDNTRKAGLMVTATAALWCCVAVPALADEPVPTLRLHPAPVPRCAIKDAIVDEPGQSTVELSTGEMECLVESGAAMILDARPHEEFSISHIPGALNVAPKPGLSMSQYTSDVAEIDRITQGDKARQIVLYCNGPFCGKSKRVAADLLAAGYTKVMRYQLGIPVWRALGHPVQVEREALLSTLDKDKTAVVIDAREPEGVRKGPGLPGARYVRAAEVAKAKDDGRLPMLDHNTRIFVVARDAAEAKAAAQEIARNAFHNVAFFAGSVQELLAR
jgi:rhodanese-related sulfurtransferase